MGEKAARRRPRLKRKKMQTVYLRIKYCLDFVLALLALLVLWPLMAVIAVILWKKIFPHPLAMWTLTAVLGGGLGNLIDRVRLGYVVDMFNFQFMTWPVFNVADILVVCGVIGFAAYYLLLDDKVRPHPAGKREAGRRKEGSGDGGADHPADGQ